MCFWSVQGDRIPLEGVVLEGESRLDTSPVTGEPVPVAVVPGSSVTSGCVNLSGVLKMRAEKVLEDSMVTRIFEFSRKCSSQQAKNRPFYYKVFKSIHTGRGSTGRGNSNYPSILTGDWNYWIYTAITFLVISCPCALVLSVPLAFFSGIGAGSKKGILFKGGVAIEALQNVKAVVMDKTGTITKGNFVVQEIVPAGSYSQDELLKTAASCEEASSHPIAVSIMAAANERRLSVEHAKQVKEISGNGILAELSEGTVLCGNRRLLEQNQVDLSAYQPKAYGTSITGSRRCLCRISCDFRHCQRGCIAGSGSHEATEYPDSHADRRCKKRMRRQWQRRLELMKCMQSFCLRIR